MTALIALFWRDLHRALGSGALWLPVLFFLLVATAFPFAVGPDAPLLRRAGGGLVWVAALLAALLPIDRLVRPDKEAGVLDQLAVRGFADEEIGRAACRERGCQNVEIPVVAGPIKKKKK